MKVICATILLGLATLAPEHALAGPIKNEQNVVSGVLTRAGVKGQTQLSDDQLVSLCEAGYTKAYFLYSGATTRTVSCSKGSISYRSISWTSTGPIMQAIDSGLRGGGRVFVHCHNGAHASGYVAAIALRQFCGYSSDQAFAYWNKTNTYGTPPGINKIKSNLRSFTPDRGLTTTNGCR